MRDIRNLNSRSLLKIDEASEVYFHVQHANNAQYDFFREVPSILVNGHPRWQVKDIDKYLERNKQ
ncbi:hypothetical protein ACFIUV_08530 [Oenococcus oeni]|uniref:Uncharacterized protein n=1 Tax=Oenococcus oeni AWRIB429 TaxID=655225 RepID=D3LC91_OENOE|nr:hypothetical protein [Oenococcus oeni]EFD87538.1 hypothetical protein AWRIB429_1971 [Oenococcus oeni AWRIB429]EJO07127.1 putative phage protein [Oenococcus oeni AWRIB422]EJO10498.1 putative phage protein [Oenococcus oeni AWRIB576]EJO11283.1 putative phage protein [Oenococcus oeni AWRIB568]KGH59711.1 hypothetical protein X467_08155 [Oenococcus oeni S28]